MIKITYEMDGVYLRPHHLETLRSFYRDVWTEAYKRIIERKYSSEFADQMIEFFQTLVDNPSIRLILTSGLDSLCESGNGCPHRRDCEGRKKEGIEREDRAAMEKFGVGIGDNFTVEDFLNTNPK